VVGDICDSEKFGGGFEVGEGVCACAFTIGPSGFLYDSNMI
jgi:hypothetical protein